MNRKPMREAAVIVDSDVVSTELGQGGSDVSEDTNSDTDNKPLSGGSEQIA